MLDWHTEGVTVFLIRGIKNCIASCQMALVPFDLPRAAPGAQLDLGVPTIVLSSDFLSSELKGSNIPAQHVGWELSLNVAEEDRNADTSESDTSIQGVPTSDLGAGLEDVGKFDGNDTQDRIVFTVALIPDGHSHHSRTPVTNEPLSSSVEDWLGTYSLGTSAIDLEQWLVCQVLSGEYP